MVLPDLSEAMRTQNACRYYRDDPVPDEVLYRAVELARFAPNGGNRCAVRFVLVRDAALRRQLGEWYLPLWREVSGAARAGAVAVAGADGVPRAVNTGFSDTERTMSDGDHFAERFGRHPVIIVVCADLAQVHPTDTSLGRLSEPEVKELLAIPEHFSTACHVTAGYPARPFPRKLHRPGVTSLAFTDTFGTPLAAPDAAPDA
jgi:nitroreductase